MGFVFSYEKTKPMGFVFSYEKTKKFLYTTGRQYGLAALKGENHKTQKRGANNT